MPTLSLRFRPIVRRVRRWWRERQDEKSWRRAGCPLPASDHVKHRLLREIARRHGARIFVETGTFHGGTLVALRTSFDRLHSIELDRGLYQQAVAAFANDRKIELWHGDSGEILPQVLTRIGRPALFWLDGHYSGPGTACGSRQTPIQRELQHISKHRFAASHLIVIDDARQFNGTNDYPTLDELRASAAALGFPHMRAEHDMILLSAVPLR